MAKVDVPLGNKVREHLVKLGLETPQLSEVNKEKARASMQVGVQKFLKHMGQLPDPSRDDTPYRVSDMFVDDLCWGLDYSKFPKATATPNGPKGAYNQMVLVKNIQTISLCEHHFQTIYGKAHIAYIPKDRVLGLSKFARINEFFARRPQIQERMTEQVFAALSFILETEDVAVAHDCEHFCMKARGAMQHSASTVTDKVGGRFMTNPALRQEFFDAIRRG